MVAAFTVKVYSVQSVLVYYQNTDTAVYVHHVHVSLLLSLHEYSYICTDNNIVSKLTYDDTSILYSVYSV